MHSDLAKPLTIFISIRLYLLLISWTDRLSCDFRFCFACIDNWTTITNLCPLCQNEFQLITCVPVIVTKLLKTVFLHCFTIILAVIDINSEIYLHKNLFVSIGYFWWNLLPIFFWNSIETVIRSLVHNGSLM